MRLAFAMAVGAALLAVPAAGEQPERLSHTFIPFEAPMPCGAACPYVPGGLNHTVRYSVDVPVVTPEPGEEACRPTPLSIEGSWDDRIVVVPDLIAGRTPARLDLELYPLWDSDGFLCRVTGYGTSEERWDPVTATCNSCEQVWGECPPSGWHTGFGCHERHSVAIGPGDVIVLRVYNQADFSPVYGFLAFFG